MARSLKYSTAFSPSQLACMRKILKKNGWETEDTVVNGIELYAFNHRYAIADWKKIWSEKPFPEDFPYIPILISHHHKILGKIEYDIRCNPDIYRHMQKMQRKAYETLTEAHETGPEFYETSLKYKRLTKEAQV